MATSRMKTQVLNHLKEHKTITPMEALNSYSCYRLAARIHELREEGWDIASHPLPNRMAKYTLMSATKMEAANDNA